MADYGEDDHGIMSTNDSANSSKKSCVALNYWEDPFIDCFSKSLSSSNLHGDRKPPEINRGYYARVAAITNLVQRFLTVTKNAGSQCQVVSLGAGFDTLYWRLKSLFPQVCDVKTFVEVDLMGVTARKVSAIRRRPNLLKVLGEDIRFSQTELHAIDYHLISGDLRSIETSESCRQKLQDKFFSDCGLEKDRPTIFIAECVLVYMESSASNALLKWITDHFNSCVFLNYEQVNLDDKFGEIMKENLHDMHADLLGLDQCKSLETQRQRFLDSGFEESHAWDMNSIYNDFLPRAEIQRIEKIEFLDEKNLLEQLLTHYCIALAAKGFKKFIDIKDCIGF